MAYALGEAFIMSIAPRYSGALALKQKAIVSAVAPVLTPTLQAYSINTKLRIAHFMAQAAHECAGFRTTEEFASGAAYEGRVDLGNTHKGDGVRYKGRGLIQLTGRANYRAIGKRLGLDLEDNPKQAAEPATSLRIACEYWNSRSINIPADKDDLVRVTHLINGGTNGLTDRGKYLAKAKVALTALDAATVIGGSNPVLRRGMKGDAAGNLQRLLREKGFPVVVDNDFGPATEIAVIAFQKVRGLTADGIVGKATWAALI